MRLVIALFYLSGAAWGAEKSCHTGVDADLILSVNSDSQKAVHALNQKMATRKIEVAAENTGPNVQFVKQRMKTGDCVLYDSKENLTLDVASVGQKQLTPVVYFRKSDGAKHFGLITTEELAKLSKAPHTETSTKAVTDYRGKHRDLTILYVLCPIDRNEVCHLTIRHKGRWVMKGKKKWEIAVLARAERKPGVSIRLTQDMDTPQGIYPIWATMFTDEKGFGGHPRIDLDASLPPINAYPYDINAYVLDELVPAKSLNDYWINEWPLAYRLGRVHLRIHGNSGGAAKVNFTSASGEKFRTTEGCINAGDGMMPLLEKLVQLGVFTKEGIAHVKPEDLSTLGWKVTPRLGRVFLILKDEDWSKL